MVNLLISKNKTLKTPGNFIIQNFRDDVENSNLINTLPKKPIDQLLKDEEKAKNIASEKYSVS